MFARSFYEDLDNANNKDRSSVIDRHYNDELQATNIEVVEDLNRQKQGIDKILTLANGMSLNVEEKIRYRDYIFTKQDMGDILLEEWSNYEHRKPGWVTDPSKVSDVISYVVFDKRGDNHQFKGIILLDYKALQKAFKKHYRDWKKQYPTKKAYTRHSTGSYSTTNLAIPTKVLLQAIEEETPADRNGWKIITNPILGD